jgi:hypothetical protein
MLKRMTLVLSTALCAVAVSLPGPAAHAAGTPSVIAKAQAGDAGTLVWVDTDKGTGLDSKTATAIRDQFSGTEWAILDNGAVTVSKAGKVLVAALFASNDDGTFMPLHARIGTMTVDGTIYRNDNDKSKGFGELFINQLASDGKSARSMRIGVGLDFGSQQAPADNGNNGFGGGF